MRAYPLKQHHAAVDGATSVLQEAIDESTVFNAGVMQFKTVHQTLLNGELKQTSTDNLLSDFLRDSKAPVSPEGYMADPYSDDDFEAMDEVEEEESTTGQAHRHSGLFCMAAVESTMPH